MVISKRVHANVVGSQLSVTLCSEDLNWTPTFKWYTARIVVKNGHQKRHELGYTGVDIRLDSVP